MISEALPVNDIFEINTGSESAQYSKQALFSPDFVQEISYVHGCHKHHAVIPDEPVGNLGYFRLYHYRMIGGVDRMIERHEMYVERMSSFNKQHKMGFHYLHPAHAKREEWNYLMSKAEKLW